MKVSKPKLTRAELVRLGVTEQENHCFVIRIYQKLATEKWYHTIAKDAIRVVTGKETDSKAGAIGEASKDLGKLAFDEHWRA